MGPPPQLPVGAAIPPPPPPQHPHTMYHSQHRNQQQHQYQQGYPPQSQAAGMNRYGPPPMHTLVQQQQHSRIHHHQNHSVAPSNYRHPPVQPGGRHPINTNSGHHHYMSHAPIMVAGAAHGMGPMQPQRHHRHQYPPRPFHIHPHQATLQQHLHAPFSGMATNPTVQSVSYSGATVLSSKANVSATVSDEIKENETVIESSKLDSPTMQRVTNSCESKVESSINNENGILEKTKTSICDGATIAKSPPPTTVSFKDCIDQRNNTASTSNILCEVKSNIMESRNAMTVMSPITMCFERMLGAGKFMTTYWHVI